MPRGGQALAGEVIPIEVVSRTVMQRVVRILFRCSYEPRASRPCRGCGRTVCSLPGQWSLFKALAMTKYAQVLDSADQLATEEQESLVEVLQHRLAERRLAELVEAVKSARREFKAGRCHPATSAQIVRRIRA